MAPIMQSVALTYDSEPGPTARRAGAFLALVSSNSNSITCAMFLTAMAGNPLIASLASQQGVDISWATWALGAIVPGLVALIVVPALIYTVYPPELKKTPKVRQTAADELQAIGPMSYGEKVLAATFVVLLLLWTVGDLAFDISATAHISAMYIAFLGAALALGAPPLLAALILGYCSNIFQSLTHYAGGASPTLFGTKYNSAAQWWTVGLIAGMASLLIWIFVGGAWMKLVGIW